MVDVAFFFKSAVVASLLLMALGLIEPWWVLWWKAVQNRLKVIKVYGTIAVLSWALSYLIENFLV